jgi:hypothetical protein
MQPLVSARYTSKQDIGGTFPPRTSSPIIMHPAVCIIRCPLPLNVGVDDDVIPNGDEVRAAADVCV